ncbi:hypothetical protein [Vibrio agarivorans]|uniref:hypothetical protein n=1 Tax=Vibrio agarivorans TaxID=153622 RepID=UPI0025B2B7CB|nr:hypothetical protein [Vibrio agarivorans]MDN3663136.1 hypothetical protein [Vibrio agarivorans]
MGNELRKEMKIAIDQLEVRAKLEGRRIVKAKGVKNIFIGEAYKDIKLNLKISSVLACEMTFSKKYEKSSPSSVLELIYACRGLNNTIEQLQRFQLSNLMSYPIDVIDYVDTLEQELSFAKGRTYERRSSSTKNSIPFCALCWKRTFSSDYYCKDHHSTRNHAIHKQAKNQLFTAIKTLCDDESTLEKYDYYQKGYLKGGRLAHNLYSWTASFAPNIQIPIVSHTLSDNPFDKTIASTIQTVKKIYPITASKLAPTLENKTVSDLKVWIIKIIDTLDSTEATVWAYKDVELWLKKSSEQELLSTLLNVLRRYEAFKTIQSATSTSGPTKGKNANVELRESIQRLAKQQREQTGKVNQSEIARKLDLSRQRISMLMKELEGKA